MKNIGCTIVMICVFCGCKEPSSDTSELWRQSVASLEKEAWLQTHYSDRLLNRIENIAQERAWKEDRIRLDSARELMKVWKQSDEALLNTYEVMVEETGGYEEGYEGVRPMNLDKRVRPNGSAWNHYQNAKDAFLMRVEEPRLAEDIKSETKSLIAWESEITSLRLKYQQMLQRALLKKAVYMENSMGVPVITSFRIEYIDQEQGFSATVVPVYRLNPDEMKVIVNTSETYEANNGLAAIAFEWEAPLSEKSLKLEVDIPLKHQKLDTVLSQAFSINLHKILKK